MSEAATPGPRMGFAGNRLLRDGDTRTPETLAAALAHPGAQIYLCADDGWLCRDGAGTPLPGFGLAEAAAVLGEEAEIVLLGLMPDGAPRLAAAVGGLAGDGAAAGEARPGIAGAAAVGLRMLGTGQLLDADTEGQLAQAAHLLGWHRRTRFCGSCGGETVGEAAGLRRRCTRCGELFFPRTDPVSIMLVHDGRGRCVLGRQPRFAPNLWSCLAGFVEAGETLEEAVRRETLEEAGLAVGAVTYLASQPWPFPGSLMIGCLALATTGTIAFDGRELEDCRWFGREEVSAMLAGTHAAGLVVPGAYAIAHHLIRAFAAGEEGPGA